MPPRSSSSDGTQLGRRRRGRRLTLLALAAAVALAGPASAQTGGAGGGGATFVAKPSVSKVSCVRACASRRRARSGSTLALQGRNLGGVTKVTFLGSNGSRDDRPVTVRPGSPIRLLVRVPSGAMSGPIALGAAPSARAARTRPVAILPPPPPRANARLTPVPGLSGVESGTSRTKLFQGGRPVTFSFRVAGSGPQGFRVDLVNEANGGVVQTWTPAVTPGQVQSVAWDGLAGGVPAPPGRYSFRIGTAAGSIASAAQVPGVPRDAFDVYDHIFPVRGRHNFGGAGAHFGAGRGGRTHQGHDVFARCGTPLIAARGGVVQFSGFHRAAGNYLVIDGDGPDYDYAYMHLAEPIAFRPGDRVYTGQRLGSVGQTGNARGCHLHFEMWGAPGWFEGGAAFDPLPSLMAWDGWS